MARALQLLVLFFVVACGPGQTLEKPVTPDKPKFGAYIPRRAPIVRGHVADGNTLALYQFDGDLTDSSGNSRDLAALVGTVRYGDIGYRNRGLILDGATAVRRTTRTAAFDVTGAISILAVIRFTVAPTGTAYVVNYGGGGEAGGADNVLWALAIAQPGAGAATGFSVEETFSEHATGTNDDALGAVHIPINSVIHVAATRNSAGTSWSHYVNGVLYDTLSVTAPTVSSPAQYITVGGNDAGGVSGSFYNGVIDSLKIESVQLTNAQVFDEFANCLGQ